MYQSSLDAKAVAFAREFLGESDEIVKESLLALQQYLENNPNINARSDPRSLIYFLRSCKFNVGQAERKLKK